MSGRPYPEGFSAEDLLIAQTLATQAGVLLRNSQIYKTALEDERASRAVIKIARELATQLDMAEAGAMLSRVGPDGLRHYVYRCSPRYPPHSVSVLATSSAAFEPLFVVTCHTLSIRP